MANLDFLFIYNAKQCGDILLTQLFLYSVKSFLFI